MCRFAAVGKLSGGHQAAIMVLGVEQHEDKDVVVTGSKDHYIKVHDYIYRISNDHYTNIQDYVYRLSKDHYVKVQDYDSCLHQGTELHLC